VNVMSRSGLLALARKHPETLGTVSVWYKTVRKASWHGLHEVRRDFPGADQVGDVLIFDILGGNYRLIVGVNYARQLLFIKALLTHGEYDRKGWMKWA
jgi:mRNA interferase HigB